MGSRQRIPYRERILEYCQRHRISVPRNFDAPRSSEKFVVVDESTSPSVLLPRSTYLKKEVISILTDSANAGRKFRVLDFKHCRELHYRSDGKLTAGSEIDCLCAEERRKREWLAHTDA
jgi:hypothetical protein